MQYRNSSYHSLSQYHKVSITGKYFSMLPRTFFLKFFLRSDYTFCDHLQEKYTTQFIFKNSRANVI